MLDSKKRLLNVLFAGIDVVVFIYGYNFEFEFRSVVANLSTVAPCRRPYFRLMTRHVRQIHFHNYVTNNGSNYTY